MRSMMSTPMAVKRRLKRIRRLVARQHHPLASMTKQQVIDTLRKSREELWEAKLAARA